jgi:ketosteroid isomerase-like protein
MSRESLDSVRRVHAALSAGEVDAVIALCDPNFRLDMSDRVFNPAVYEGHDGIREFISEVREVWETFTWEPIELEEYDEVVAVVIHSTGKARGSGLELDRRAAMLWEVEGDRAISLTFYRDPGEALAVARGERPEA